MRIMLADHTYEMSQYREEMQVLAMRIDKFMEALAAVDRDQFFRS